MPGWSSGWGASMITTSSSRAIPGTRRCSSREGSARTMQYYRIYGITAAVPGRPGPVTMRRPRHDHAFRRLASGARAAAARRDSPRLVTCGHRAAKQHFPQRGGQHRASCGNARRNYPQSVDGCGDKSQPCNSSGRPLAAPRRTGPGRAGHPGARCPPTGPGHGPPPGHARQGNAGPVHPAPPHRSSPAAVRPASPGPARTPGPVPLAALAGDDHRAPREGGVDVRGGQSR